MVLYWLTRFFAGIFTKIFFRLKVEGQENLPKEGGFILAANHTSSLDPFIVTAAIPHHIRWLIIYEYYDFWGLSWILQHLRFIRVENNLPKEAFRALWQKEVVGVFPEGRRSWTGKLGPARAGVALLARKTACPIVPVGINGSFAALPRTRKDLKLYPITVRIGKPLFFSESAPRQDNERLDQENADRIMQGIAALLY